MKKIIEIIEQLRATSSTKEKENILRKNKDNELLQKVLEYTYNPYKKYGFSEKMIESLIKTNYKTNPNVGHDTIFDLLEVLSLSNICDELRGLTNIFLCSANTPEERDLYKCMILKDLRCNISAKTINKVFKGLIPTFDVMLASKYFDNEDKVKGDFIVTTKLDGGRAVIIKQNGNVKVMTRQGQLIEDLVEIIEESKLLPDNYVYDGELLLRNDKNLASKDLYRATMKVTRKDGIKKNLIFNCFDIVPIEDFKNGICKTKCIDRKNQLHKLLSELNLEHIIEVPMLYVGSDRNKIIELLNVAKSRDEEGVMVNTLNGCYEAKRTKELLKVKTFNDIDLKVISLEKGEGKYSNTLGRINVQFKDNIVGVGSGFSDEMRNEVYSNQSKYIGKIAKIQYFEITQNSKDNKESLRFPVFIEWRFDKDDASYN